MNSKNKLSAPNVAADEKLGSALVNGLKEIDPGQCPSHEEIAALLDRKMSREKRNIIMNHLSTCDSCYEIFMLAVDLQKGALKEFRKENFHLVLFKPLALAASILIVIFSIYLFYKAGVPKTSEELMNTESAEVGKDAVKPQPGTPPGYRFADKKKKRDLKDLSSPGYTGTDEDRIATPAAGDDRPKAPALEKPAAEIPRQEGLLKQAGEVGAGASTAVQAEEQAPHDELSRQAVEQDKEQDKARDNARDRAVGVGQKLEAAATLPPKKMKAAVQQSPKKSTDREQEKQPAPSNQFALRENEADSSLDNELQQNPAWSQANLLNMQSQQYRVNIPAQELRDMFKQSIDLTSQLKASLEKIKKEVAHSGDVKKIAAFVEGVTPLITVTTGGDDISIYPNIGYFLSKSEPGSVEHRFFYLARSGWCEPVSGCYGLEKRRDAETRVRLEKVAGKAGDSGESPLGQWKNLYPQLTGVFQEVASRTIAHLEDSNKK